MSACRICGLPPSERIAENDSAFAFFVQEPARAGHMAVAVREHRPLLVDARPAEAAAVLRLARALAAVATPVIGAEKFYLAAVADVDRHFHLHLLPKRSEDPRLGPFLFSPTGWQGGPPAARNSGIEKQIRDRIAPSGRARLEVDPTRLESVIAANYASISFEEGEDPDWSLDRTLFAPGARLTRVSRDRIDSMDPDEYRHQFEAIRAERGWTSFWEGEIESKVDVFGGIAHVASRYEARPSAASSEILGAGVNSIQLIHRDDGWKIFSVLWETWITS